MEKKEVEKANFSKEEGFVKWFSELNKDSVNIAGG